MLETLEITNFRCFQSTSVKLRPLTVLIGPNDSGKSAFLAAVEYFLSGRQFEAWDHWRQNPSDPVSIGGLGSEGQRAHASTANRIASVR